MRPQKFPQKYQIRCRKKSIELGPWRLLRAPVAEPEARDEHEEADEKVRQLQGRRRHQEHPRPRHLEGNLI